MQTLLRRRSLRAVLASGCALSLALACSLAPAPSHAASTPPPRVTVAGAPWLLTGANLPWIAKGCDFGCGTTAGVRHYRTTVDATFHRLSRSGVKVIRWYAFPGTAWQVARGAGGDPTAVQGAKVYPDLDLALSLAAKYDVYLDLVLFSDTRTIPATWMSDATQRAHLAAALGTMFARYRSNTHLVGWEVFDEPERGIDDMTVAATDAQALVQQVAATAHAKAPRARISIGSVGVDRIGLWTGLGLDFYAPHWFSGQTGTACALCQTTAQLATAYGADRPVVIGAMDTGGSASAALARLRSARTHGYAGALLWSVRGAAHPTNPLAGTGKVQLDAPWRFIYDTSYAGPRARPLNPCIGPYAGKLWCPNLRMGRPSNLYLGHRHGRTVLFSQNSINSMGVGPAELYGTRAGRLTMRAVQKIHRRSGGAKTVDTGAKLYFKAIPGQYRYWKWRNAAAMQLWRLDGAGTPVQLVRVGPKTTYCLRDLKRTHGWLKRSPRTFRYPGCSQDLNEHHRTLGTSVGWSDIYPSTYLENWIDVTHLRGCFAYVHIVDPTNVMYESNENDNANSVTVRLPWTGSNRGCPGAKPIPHQTGGSSY